MDKLKGEFVTSFYDDTYLAPGTFIIVGEDGKINKFLKIYCCGELGFPKFFVRAYEKNKKDKYHQDFNSIEFIINKDNELFPVFYFLAESLNGDRLYSVDETCEGKNNMAIRIFDDSLIVSINKDVYGVKNSSDYIDISLGDNDSCKHYEALWAFFNRLGNLQNRSNKCLVKQILK